MAELAPYSDFDPHHGPALAIVQSCSFQGGYGGLGFGDTTRSAYECDYNTTHLPNRAAQVNRVLVPAVLGYTVWKEALWAIDFAGRVHDSLGNQMNAVAPGDVSLIGTRGRRHAQPNTITGSQPGGIGHGQLTSGPLRSRGCGA